VFERESFMVPAEFSEFFLASAGAGAAFVGLLFVAVSITPQRTFGDAMSGGSPRQHLAEAVFLTLINGFIVSRFALIPGLNVGWISTAMGILGVLMAVQLVRRLAPRQSLARPARCRSLRHRHGSLRDRDDRGDAAHPRPVGGRRDPDAGGCHHWILCDGRDPQRRWSGWLNPLRDPLTAEELAVSVTVEETRITTRRPHRRPTGTAVRPPPVVRQTVGFASTITTEPDSTPGSASIPQTITPGSGA
jgi:hypothetical protein